MYTPINEFELTKEGKKVFSNLKNLVQHPMYATGQIKKIHLRAHDFSLLWNSLSPHLQRNCLDGIPFGKQLLVRT